MDEKLVRKIWQDLKSQNGQKFKVLNLIFQGKTTEQIKQNLKIERSNTVRKNYERLSDDFDLPWETPNGSVLRGEKGLRIIGERYQHILRDLDNLYVRRPPLETNCYEAILTPSGFLRIKSPQKMGKTFLVKKILKEVKENKKYTTVDLSLRAEADPKAFDNLKSFFMWLCRTISKKLKLPIQIENDWQDPLSDKLNCTLYFEKY